MAVSVFEPQISVILKKNIGRATVSGSVAVSTRFSGAQREIDLTPYLWEDGPVTVSKSVREPAGMFSITLGDRMSAIDQDTLYGLIEPMDVVEIRMARNAAIYVGKGYAKNLPLIMRGFVTNVSREEGMGSDRPARAVVISGQDYGKLLQIMQIAYLPNEVTGQLLLSSFKYFLNYGPAADPEQPASEFVRNTVKEVILPFIARMRAAATSNGVAGGKSPLLDLKVDATVNEGIVSPFGLNSWPGGTIYSLLTYFGDVGAWNELFVDDREDAPYLVYRPTPFRDPSGNYIQSMSSKPVTNTVLGEEIVSLQVTRTDAAVANYYWVEPQNFNLQTPGYLAIQAANSAPADSFYLANYANSSPDLYGFRRMEVQTQQGPRFDGQAESMHEKQQGRAVGFVSDRRATLIANNRDNVVFESGGLRIRGNEAIKAGTNVRVVRGADVAGAANGGGLTSEFYAPQVTHEFVPFRSYLTSISLERGTGFIERIQRGAGTASPYLSEIDVRGVYA